MAAAPGRALAGRGERRLTPRRALDAGVGIAALLLAGSIVLAALLRLAIRLGGAAGVSGSLDLPAVPAGASAAATWSYAVFQSSLLPHPVPGTGDWTWGSGCLLLTAAIAALAFRQALGRRSLEAVVLLAAPSLLVGVAAGGAELLSDGSRAPLELAPLVAALPLAATLLAAGWRRLRQSRAAVPWLRALVCAAAALAAGVGLASIPVLLLTPRSGMAGAGWILCLVPYLPNTVLRATFAGGLHPQAAAGLVAFALAAVATGVHLRARSAAERAGYLGACLVLPALATTAGTPAGSAAGIVAAFIAALPGAALVAILGAGLGPLVGSTAAGHRVSNLPLLRRLGDRLPPPSANELTARDMEGSGAGAPSTPARPGAMVARVAVAVAVLVSLLATVLVATVTLNEPAADHSPPQIAAARAYLSALSTNDAARIWPTIEVDAYGLPTGAPRLLSAQDLASLLAVTGNQRSRMTGLQLVIGERSGPLTLVHAHYLEVGTPRDDTLPLVETGGRWRVRVLPSAISVRESATGIVLVDGTRVPVPSGVPVAVLPGVHRVEADYPPPFQPGKVTVDAEEPYPAVTNAAVAPRLDDAMQAGARSAVDAALRRCAASTSPRPDHCPQAVPAPPGEAVRWSTVGDAAATAAIAPDGAGGIVATGVFQMIAAYAVHVPEDVKHVASAGSFRVALHYSAAAWSAGDVVAGGQPVPRPAAGDPDLRAAVAAGFQRCAASPLLRPADCPQTVPSRFYVKDVAWRLDADPLAGAQTGFDTARGVLTVTGDCDLSVTYNEGGQQKTARFTGPYRADLLWDGRRPVLVGIERS